LDERLSFISSTCLLISFYSSDIFGSLRITDIFFSLPVIYIFLALRITDIFCCLRITFQLLSGSHVEIPLVAASSPILTVISTLVPCADVQLAMSNLVANV